MDYTSYIIIKYIIKENNLRINNHGRKGDEVIDQRHVRKVLGAGFEKGVPTEGQGSPPPTRPLKSKDNFSYTDKLN